jgi:hypothetical protein
MLGRASTLFVGCIVSPVTPIGDSMKQPTMLEFLASVADKNLAESASSSGRSRQ